MTPQAYPTLEQFAANVAAVLGKIEVIEQELYDRIVYPTAGLAVFNFFTTPKGAGFSSEALLAAAGNKTDADTNMTQNGQLPAPQAFWIDNVQVDFDPGSVSTANLFASVSPGTAAAVGGATSLYTPAQDKNLVINSGWVQLFIGQKPYYQNGPLSYFPPRAQKRVDAAIGSDSTASKACSETLMWIMGNVRTLDPGLGLATGFNFGVNINFPVLSPTAANNGRLKVLLGGWLFRAAQ